MAYKKINKKIVLFRWRGKYRPCPKCSDTKYSEFDKLYIEVFGKCYDCDKSIQKELDRRADYIFNL